MKVQQQSIGETIPHNEAVKYLVHAVQRLSLSRDMESVMRIVRTTAREISGADGATFVLRDNNMCYYADEDAIGPLWKGQRFPMSACISGWAMLNRQPAVIENIYADSRIPVDAYRPTFVKSLVMVPIRSIDPVGAIGTYWAHRHNPTEDEVTMLQSLADVTAVALENIQVYNELEQRVKERTSELIDSLNREKEMTAMRTQFFSMASHEFKTPLSGILTSTSLLESYNQQEQQTEQRAKHINRIKSCAKHLIGIVNDFLAMDKIEQGKTELVFEPFDFKKFTADVIEQVDSSLKNGQSIRYAYYGDADIVQVKNILRNVLLNLLSNASKYSGENQPVDLCIEVLQGEVTIQVKDHGIGIPEEDQPHIFSNFFRAGNTAGIQGTGLGLNIVKRYMELLNGSIRFTSRPGEGTTFTIQFKSAA
jgi:signal transduction histidine kinase